MELLTDNLVLKVSRWPRKRNSEELSCDRDIVLWRVKYFQIRKLETAESTWHEAFAWSKHQSHTYAISSTEETLSSLMFVYSIKLIAYGQNQSTGNKRTVRSAYSTATMIADHRSVTADSKVLPMSV